MYKEKIPQIYAYSKHFTKVQTSPQLPWGMQQIRGLFVLITIIWVQMIQETQEVQTTILLTIIQESLKLQQIQGNTFIITITQIEVYLQVMFGKHLTD